MSPATKDRDLLCYIGATMRKRDPNVWVRALVRLVQSYNARGIGVIVDDCRFRNELATLRRMGFAVVKCEAAATIQLYRLKQLYARNWSDHAAKMSSPSECDLDDLERSTYDYIADESETLETHADRVVEVMNARTIDEVKHV